METRLISNKSEIYVGGGKWLTENKATYFPTFTRRRFLRSGETIGDFKEISDAEKTALEKLRDGWTRPPQIFIDQWNAACGVWGRYNEETGYFELNGLTDITYEEAVEIYIAGPLLGDADVVFGEAAFDNIRTNLPAARGCGIDYNARMRRFGTGFSGKMIVVNLCDVSGKEVCYVKPWNSDIKKSAAWSHYTFTAREYIGIIDLRTCKVSHPDNAVGSAHVEKLFIRNLHTYFDARSLTALRLECWRFMIDEASNTEPITITVHVNTYSKITDPNNPEWNELLTLAAEKNITFATIE